MITAYDEPSARLAAAAGVDLLLVGDSLANVVLGHEDTLHVTIDGDVPPRTCGRRGETRGARRGRHAVAELSRRSSPTSVRNAAHLIRSWRRQREARGGSRSSRASFAPCSTPRSQ